MINKITHFLKQLQQDKVNHQDSLSVELASAVLYCEVMNADGEISASEQAQITKLLKRQFALNEEEISELISQAQHNLEQATDLYRFTRLINAQFSIDEKIHMIEQLWHIAYADGHLSEHENHLIRKLADLLHLRHHEYIQGKINAQQAAQGL